ncbi:MAG: hypothetical protein ACJA0Y_001041 [Maricaulis maris]|jgi:hypothetical protein|uniref:hypothetical protein n=1 Tax=Maricaulis maris TaxID=74318 RepID=UPI0000DCF1EC|nr:hypothetical protein [Maricaulis maris]
MLISMMKSRSSLTRLISVGLLTASLAVGGASAQDDVTGDPNARSPQIVIVPLGDEEGEAHFVVGEMAWGDVLGLLNQLQSETGDSVIEVAQTLWSSRDLNPPFFLFELARLTAESDPEFAVQAYFLGRSRTMYDAARCLDSTALDVINEASAYAGETVVQVIASRPELTIAAIEQVIETDGAFAGQASPWWACSFGTNAYFAAVNEQTLSGDEWLMVESRWPSVRARISSNLQGNLTMMQDAVAAATAAE